MLHISSRLALLLTLCATCAAVSSSELPLWKFVARFDATTEQLDVAACSARALPHVRFHTGTQGVARHRLAARRDSPADLSFDADAILAADWQAGECLRTRIDLGAAARAGQPVPGYRADSTLVLDPGRWLWRPAMLHPDSTIHFQLPKGWSVSVPWSPVKEATPTYRLGPVPLDWPALTAFGRFEEQQLSRPGGVLRVTILPPWKANELRRIEPVARALVQAYGQLPLRDAQVLILPLPGQRDAAPWGEVTRGGGSAVHLFVGAEATPGALGEDWTATHEFSHLLHPYLGADGRWLGEGLASYYQNVLRARTGALSAEVAWERIEAGFDRGAKEGRSPGLTLTQASRRMGSLRSYMRVYWSGAAYWLDADLALRARGSSLDAVLQRYAECCLADAMRVAPEVFVAALDRIADADIFASRYRTYADSEAFPDLTALRRHMQAQREAMAAIMRPRVLTSDTPR